MSTPALRAHVRLLHQLTVRTVPARPRPRYGGPGGRSAAQTLLLHAQIMELVAKGLGNVDIARELELSPNTVRLHRHGLVGVARK